MSDALKGQVAIEFEIPIDLRERLVEFRAQIGFNDQTVLDAAPGSCLDRGDTDSTLRKNGNEPPKGVMS